MISTGLFPCEVQSPSLHNAVEGVDRMLLSPKEIRSISRAYSPLVFQHFEILVRVPENRGFAAIFRNFWDSGHRPDARAIENGLRNMPERFLGQKFSACGGPILYESYLISINFASSEYFMHRFQARQIVCLNQISANYSLKTTFVRKFRSENKAD